MEGTNYSRLLRKQIGELMDLNEALVTRVEQLKSYIHRSGFEVPLVEAGMSAPIIENTNSVEARGSKRQRTGFSGSYSSSHHPQDSIPWEMLETSILHSVREVISKQVLQSTDSSLRILPRESEERNTEGPSDILNEAGNSSRNSEKNFQNQDTSRALNSVSRSRREPAERSMIKSESSQANNSPKQSKKPLSRSIDDPPRLLRPTNSADSRGSLSSFNGFSARNPAHNETDQRPDYDQSEPSVGQLFDEPLTNGELRNDTTFDTNGNLEEEDTLKSESRNYPDENIMDSESRADTATIRGPEQSEQITEQRDNNETGLGESEPAETAKQSNIRIEPEVRRLDEFQLGNQGYQEDLRQEQEDLQYEQAELQIEEEPRETIESEAPQPESRLEQLGRRETLPPLEEDRTPQRTPAQRSRFSELVASVAQPDPRLQREERPKLYGRYSEPSGAPAKSALKSSGTPLRPRPKRHSEHVSIDPMPPVPSSILRAFDRIQNSQSPPSEPKPASPAKPSQAGAGTGRFVPRMSNSLAPPETPQNPPNQSRTQNPSQSHTGPVGTSTPAPASKSRTNPRDSLTEGSSYYQSANSTFGDRENASVTRSVSFKLPGNGTDNTSSDTLTPRGTPARLPRAPHPSEKPVVRPTGESSSQENRVPSRRVLNSRNVYELDDSQASLPDMSEMKVNPGDISEVRGRPKSLGHQ